MSSAIKVLFISCSSNDCRFKLTSVYNLKLVIYCCISRVKKRNEAVRFIEIEISSFVVLYKNISSNANFLQNCTRAACSRQNNNNNKTIFKTFSSN